MPDQLTDRARKAAEEIADDVFKKLGKRQNDCPPDCDQCHVHAECKAKESVLIEYLIAIIERHMREMTLVELGQLVQQREKWLQDELSAGRMLHCQGELKNTDRLTELEKELSEGCELIETVMHQYDEG